MSPDLPVLVSLIQLGLQERLLKSQPSGVS